MHLPGPYDQTTRTNTMAQAAPIPVKPIVLRSYQLDSLGYYTRPTTKKALEDVGCISGRTRSLDCTAVSRYHKVHKRSKYRERSVVDVMVGLRLAQVSCFETKSQTGSADTLGIT